MIKIKTGLNGIEETITRPILIRVTEDLMKYLGFNHDIYYTLDEHDTVDMDKNELGQIKSYSSPRDEHIVITHEESASDDSDLSLSYIRPDYQVVYEDKDIGASIMPLYLKRKMTIDFKYIAKSRSLVNAIINNLRLITASDGMYLTHTLLYHYTLPDFCFRLVSDINDKKNNMLATPLDIETYINQTFPRVTTVNAPDGDSLKSDIAIRDSQTGVLGYITTNLSDIKKESVEEEAGWSVSFSYEFEYESVVQLSSCYPIMVYNQLLDPLLRVVMKQPMLPYKGNFTAGTQGIMDITNAGRYDYLTIEQNKTYITIPQEDGYKLPRPDPYTARLLSIIITIDVNNPTELFNIMDIPHIIFKPEILDFWKAGEYKYISEIYRSMFHIALYTDGERDSNNYVIMDANLNLTTYLPMKQTSLYRVVFSVLTDLSVLSQSVHTRMNKYLFNLTMNGTVVPKLVEYFAAIFGVDASYFPKRNDPLDILLAIEDNGWLKFWTRQETVIVSAVLTKKS